MKSRTPERTPDKEPDRDDDDSPEGFCAGGRKRKRGGKAEGTMAMERLDRRPRKAGGGKIPAGSPPLSMPKGVAYEGHIERKDGGGNWIAGAVKHKGALHRQLGVPEGEKIPESKLKKAANSDNPTLSRRARLAETLKGFH
jgi:hypothetical protein